MALPSKNSPPKKAPGAILLVDDNPTNLQVLFQTLEGEGHRLLIAKNGETAIAIAEKVQPELILLDIMMPGELDGFEVCRRLKSRPQTRGSEIIFLSALNETKDKVKGLDLGAVDYITKPFQAEEVIARVDTHLTIHRLRKELESRNQELETANARMEKDLRAASRVQRALLPSTPPASDKVRFAWKYRPCEAIGGDALNVFTLDDKEYGFYLLDTCGHGVEAALISVSAAHELAQSFGPESLSIKKDSKSPSGFSLASPSTLAESLNRRFPMEATAGLYITMIYGILNTETLELRYINAAHPPPFWIKTGLDGAPVFPTAGSPSLPIGAMEGTRYSEIHLQLEKGDRLYLRSDGLEEQFNAASEALGTERLSAGLRGAASLTLDESLDQMFQQVDAWKGDLPQADDWSALALEII